MKGVKHMKICFLSPPQKYKNQNVSKFTSLNEFLGIGYAVSLLKSHGFQTDILYYDTESLNSDICQQILEGGYTFIGFPSYYFNQIQLARIMNFVHRNRPDAFFFLGGFLSTLSLDSFQKLKYLQCAVIGECEQTLLELAIAIQNGDDWRKIFGLAYVEDGVLIKTARRDLIADLDILPFPYREPGQHEVLPLITSRGCYGKCNYCGLNEFYRMSNGRTYRRRSPENVVQELNELCKRHKVKHIQISDGNFHVASRSGRDWFDEFHRLIKEQNINLTYSCYTRVNEIISAPDLFKKFRSIGLNKIFIGVESFVQSDLDFYQKQVTVEDNIKALAIAEDLSIEYDLGIMLFNPITTPESILEFIHTLRSINSYPNIYHIVKPISINSTAIASIGTPLYSFVCDNDLQVNNIRSYKFVHCQMEVCYSIISSWSSRILPCAYKCYELESENKCNNSDIIKANHDLFFLDLDVIEYIAYATQTGLLKRETDTIPVEFDLRLLNIQETLQEIEKRRIS